MLKCVHIAYVQYAPMSLFISLLSIDKNLWFSRERFALEIVFYL